MIRCGFVGEPIREGEGGCCVGEPLPVWTCHVGRLAVDRHGGEVKVDLAEVVVVDVEPKVTCPDRHVHTCNCFTGHSTYHI